MKNIPIGLLAVQQLVERLPKEREAILDYELTRRRREHALYETAFGSVRFRVITRLKSAIFFGVTIFLLLFAAGQLSAFVTRLQNPQHFSVRVPLEFIHDPIPINLPPLLATSTALGWFASIPVFSVEQSQRIALVAALLLIIAYAGFGLRTWFRGRILREAMEELEEEIRALEEWIKKPTKNEKKLAGE